MKATTCGDLAYSSLHRSAHPLAGWADTRVIPFVSAGLAQTMPVAQGRSPEGNQLTPDGSLLNLGGRSIGCRAGVRRWRYRLKDGGPSKDLFSRKSNHKVVYKPKKKKKKKKHLQLIMRAVSVKTLRAPNGNLSTTSKARISTSLETPKRK